MNSLKMLERLILTAWIGSHWAIGYIAAPVLFSALDSRRLAGELAGDMFYIVYVIGLVCGIALLAITALGAPGPRRRNWRLWAIAVMLAFVAFSFFELQPWMADLKAQGLVEGSEVAARFGVLHGISSLLYLVVSLLGAALVVAGGAVRKNGTHSL